ncbi:hypothetical protein QP794_23870 [Paenibacillus sp. UMB7766-LJ446]|uniref:hypothetical protein n=1 Tax=Paenibacillus sp. UMB7766-LJ446 TaxID=3046313 RepID=UPI00255054FD|nr:hypothetical protein [Paenibacillus sp. UMB7766-LJ446]MDK8193130.1 hypothetical protein [Paenibacillus sp. UMB7766-LJ446]
MEGLVQGSGSASAERSGSGGNMGGGRKEAQAEEQAASHLHPVMANLPMGLTRLLVQKI